MSAPLPKWPQDHINNFLTEALKKAQPTLLPPDLTTTLSKHLASMATAADFARNLQTSFRPPKSPIQDMIEKAAKTAALFANVGLPGAELAKAAASMKLASLPPLHEDLLRSFRPPKSTLTEVIEAAQKAALGPQMDLLREQAVRLSTLRMYPSPAFGTISQAIQQAMAAAQLWQSARLSDFASRILRESEFQQAVIQRLTSEPLPEDQPPPAQISREEILKAVEEGIEKSGVLAGGGNIEASVSGMFSWWAKLPPDVRTLAINLLAGILLLVAEYGYFVTWRNSSPPPASQRVRIVQRITNNVFVNAGFDRDQRRQLRIVTKDGLHVFRSHRRDSERLWTLQAAQVVTVRSQKRNWTQIEWKDQLDQGTHVGWVFTRYLKKL